MYACFVVLLLGALAEGVQKFKVVDLSYHFDNETIYWPTAIAFQLQVKHRGLVHPEKSAGEENYWYEMNEFTTNEHTGTHIDSPAHFAQNRWTVDQIPVERMIAPVSIIDLRNAVKDNADYEVTVGDIQRWELLHGKPVRPLVILWTGWAARWPDRLSYLGTDKNDTSLLRFPGLHPDAARFLAEERAVYGVGIDTASIDRGQSVLKMSHRIMAEKNIFYLENVNTMPLVGLVDYGVDPILIATPLKITSGSGSPVRPILLLDVSLCRSSFWDFLLRLN